jgi:ABC-type transport system involved in cytochrome c biogenesis permease subunit
MAFFPQYEKIAIAFLILFIGTVVYMSYSVEHLLALKEGEKPSFWAIPGAVLFGSLITVLTSAGAYRVLAALFI